MKSSIEQIDQQSYVVFEYLYRDASNYKAHGAFLLQGKFSEELRQAITRHLIDGLFFVPGRIGVAPLCDELFQYSDGPTEDDHPWHEFVCLRAAEWEDVERLSSAGTVERIIALLKC